MSEEYELPSSPRRRVKQSISIPFLWEEKPGTPKREWSMTKPNPWIVPPSPARLVVSIPFLWEEKPGKPFSGLNTHEDHHKSSNSSDDGTNYFEDWCSLSEIDGHQSSSSSITRNASMDASAMELYCPLPPPPYAGLELLFPLVAPKSGFLSKVHWEDGVVPAAYEESSTNKKCWREECGIVMKRTITLGELILLSRKLSYGRNAVDMKKKRFSMGFIKDSLLSCISLGTT